MLFRKWRFLDLEAWEVIIDHYILPLSVLAEFGEVNIVLAIGLIFHQIFKPLDLVEERSKARVQKRGLHLSELEAGGK